MRAFVALDLDAPARGRLRAAVDALRPRIPGIKWVRPEGVHLTLRFLGDTQPEVVGRLKPMLAGAAERCPASRAPLTGLGLFPERAAPRVLWIGLDLDPRVQALQVACEGAAVSCGFAPEARPFAPHLTLGRWRDRAPRPDLPALDLGVAQLDRLVLLRSEPRPGGAVYTPLASFPLSG